MRELPMELDAPACALVNVWLRIDLVCCASSTGKADKKTTNAMSGFIQPRVLVHRDLYIPSCWQRVDHQPVRDPENLAVRERTHGRRRSRYWIPNDVAEQVGQKQRLR